MIIGKEPNNEVRYYCNMQNNQFSCILNTIEFILNKTVNFSLTIKETIKFELSTKKILFPLHYLTYFEQYYFGQLLQNNKCNKTYYEEKIIFRCKSINNKSVSFVFEQFTMNIPDILLFTEKDNIYESLFVARSVSDVKSIQSNRPKPKEQRKNDLTDMAVEDDDVSPMADEEV